MELRGGEDALHASFFFVDIVGLSNPDLSTTEQIEKINVLNRYISECDSYKTVPEESKLVLPTGDGMVIAFFQWPALPLKLAIELHKKLRQYNKDKHQTDMLRVRIGLHSGPVFFVNDIRANKNLWGQGIVIARRIMDIGDADHILLSAKMAEDLRELSDDYSSIIHPIDHYIIKHGQEILVYSAHGEGFGNPAEPKVFVRIGGIIYLHIRIDASLRDPKTMLVHYKRYYHVRNISGTPLKKLIHGIATDVKKTIQDLNVKVYEEKGSKRKKLKISRVTLDKPLQKQFTTVLRTAVRPGETTKYSIEYDTEEPERYFENIFLSSCDLFEMFLDYPKSYKNSDSRIDPKIYEIDLSANEKRRARTQPVLAQKDEKIIARWSRHNILHGQSFRIEW